MKTLKRSANALLGAALALITIGGAMLGVVALKTNFTTWFPSTPESFYDGLFIAGLAFTGIGLAVCIFLAISLGITIFLVPIRAVQTWVQNFQEGGGYDLRIAKRREIEWILNFGQQELGVVGDLNRLLEWQTLNREIFWVVINKRISDKTKRLAGYFAVIPLNKVGTESVEAQQVDGTSFTADHIIPYRRGRFQKTPTSIYIGGVAAKFRARPFTLISLKARVNSEMSTRGVNLFYARAVTSLGLTLVRRNEFKPVSKYVKGYVKDQIYKYEFEKDEND